MKAYEHIKTFGYILTQGALNLLTLGDAVYIPAGISPYLGIRIDDR